MYLDRLKQKVANESKSAVANKLDISIVYLNNLLSGRKQISQTIKDKLDGIETYIINSDYPNLIKLFNVLYDNADKLEDSNLIQEIILSVRSL